MHACNGRYLAAAEAAETVIGKTADAAGNVTDAVLSRTVDPLLQVGKGVASNVVGVFRPGVEAEAWKPTTALEQRVSVLLAEHPAWDPAFIVRVCDILYQHPDLELVAHEESDVVSLDGQVSIWRSEQERRVVVAWRGTDSMTDAKLDGESVMLVPFLDDEASGLRVGVGFHNQYAPAPALTISRIACIHTYAYV